MRIRPPRAEINKAFAGIDRTVFGHVAIVGLINTVRRAIDTRLRPPFDKWLLDVDVTFGREPREDHAAAAMRERLAALANEGAKLRSRGPLHVAIEKPRQTFR
jgi:hypothetical protein